VEDFRHDVFADTWTGVDGLGRRLPDFDECGPPRAGRFVGIFYFICNTKRSPHLPLDVSRLIAANPQQPDFKPNAAHYWGEPEMGYYLSTDRWVIRRHAYLLADAGVDTLIFDTTNDVTYPETYRAVCEVFSQIRAEGEKTPQICFLASEKSIEQIWDDLYRPGRYPELWFQWQGKPLLLFGQWEIRGNMPDVRLPRHIQDFFTIRQSWAWDSLPWYGDNGYHRWPWVAHYPQSIGWDRPGVPEMVPVAVGQHPLSNIGRSFHAGHQPPTNQYDLTEFTPLGLHFAEQWQRALDVDPEFVFVTGWNEWTAGAAVCQDPSQDALQKLWNFFPGARLGRAGKELKPGDIYFIDQYNQEYSRDIEPMRGGHSDNYYYQLVSAIRRYKGVRPLPPASSPRSIDLEGSFEQWQAVTPEYRDHRFETLPRNEPGASLLLKYTHDSGRNEFEVCKVTHDVDHLYFYARTREPITPWSDANWMMLFLNTRRQDSSNWAGYDFLINWPALDDQTTSIKRCSGGWNWQAVGQARYRVEGCHLMLAVPRAAVSLGESPLRFDFHFADNLQSPGDLDDFLTSGDSAPNRRFDYRYFEGK
jgi:hypothetical protein